MFVPQGHLQRKVHTQKTLHANPALLLHASGCSIFFHWCQMPCCRLGRQLLGLLGHPRGQGKQGHPANPTASEAGGQQEEKGGGRRHLVEVADMSQDVATMILAGVCCLREEDADQGTRWGVPGAGCQALGCGEHRQGSERWQPDPHPGPHQLCLWPSPVPVPVPSQQQGGQLEGQVAPSPRGECCSPFRTLLLKHSQIRASLNSKATSFKYTHTRIR